MIEVKGFGIYFAGDPSVGIFPASWEINNGFVFDDEEDLNYFRKSLEETFGNYCNGKVTVMTFEEIEQEESNLNFENEDIDNISGIRGND